MKNGATVMDFYTSDQILIKRLERVQCSRALKGLQYEDRFNALKLTLIKELRENGDLIETLKKSGPYSCPGIQDIFTINTNLNLRGHYIKTT